MNKDRRKALAALEERLADLVKKAEDLIADLEPLRDEEQDYLDNMPESMKEGEKAETATAAVESMEQVITALQEMSDTDPVSALQEAQS